MNIRKFAAVAAFVGALFISSCGINSVTKAELEAVKPGNVLTWRYRKGDKQWFYAEKITRVEGDTVYFNAGKSESTKGGDARILEFDPRELSIKKDELVKFADEQADEKKVIWISES